MRKIQSALLGVLLSTLAVQNSPAVEATWEYAVQVSANAQTSPAQITLSWPQDTTITPSSYTVYRKSLDGTSWGSGTTLPGTATSFVDNNVTVGSAYEYQIVKVTSAYTGYGYIYAGLNAQMIESRGKLVLLVDNTYAADLTNELVRLQRDLIGDGWTVLRHDVSRTDTVPNIKALIQSDYNADQANVKAVFLFGHVPVPYSGDIVPDGHVPGHQGAWPADAYYGDMNGNWTDNSVNDTGAEDARNHNVPGDGKFDQSVIPSTVELMVGRVDLANMPGRLTWGGPATFPSERDLLRNYLNKDHKFRVGQMPMPRRGIVGDYFGIRNGESFAASGWRNFAPFFGANNITFLPDKGTWIPTLHNDAYLWAYGCGAGSLTSIGGIGNTGQYNDGTTPEMVGADVKAVFTLLFGSWFGDWDAEDDIMRGVLALPTYGLTSAWSGRPHWFVHHMALGEPIGYSARLTQNNHDGGLYQNQVNPAAGQIHVALMGDPTLRMHPVVPVGNLAATRNSSGVNLNWSASSDSVVGYHVYRASSMAGPFTRLTSSPVNATSFVDATGTSGSFVYMVRAVKLETSGSGTYFNPSEGMFINGDGSSIGILPPPITGTNTPPPVTNPPPPITVTNTPPPSGSGMTLWVDDTTPSGAVLGGSGGDSWNWVSSNPAPFMGTKAHQSNIGTGMHQHYFDWAGTQLHVNAGDTLFAYVYLDPANPPSEVMMEWNDGTWEHRAYWGANNINNGVNGTASRRSMGALPATGQWAPLIVPASQVRLEGSTLRGMTFTLFGGRATWDYSGTTSATLTNTPPPITITNTPPPVTNSPPPVTNPPPPITITNTPPPSGSGTTLWLDDTTPSGAVLGGFGGDSWNWVSSNPAPFMGTKAHQSNIGAGMHQHYFDWAGTQLHVNAGDTLFTYIYLDPANLPSEVMMEWNDGTWDHRAYWGANNINNGVNGTASRRFMGALPAAGQWAPLIVPASQVSLEGSTLRGMTFTLFGGRATWDYSGTTSATLTNTPPPITITNTPPPVTNSPPPVTNPPPPITITNTPPPIIITNKPPTGTVSSVDDTTLRMPKPGDSTLHVLSPKLLELVLINTAAQGSSQVSQWNFVNSGSFQAPSASQMTVTVDGQPVAIQSMGFKRRPLSAPLNNYDLRIENCLYLLLASPVTDNQTVVVKNPDGTLWSSSTQFSAAVNPLRYSPAIHVNQEGYVPSLSKQAMIGYYLGNLGEMVIPASAGFALADAGTGAIVYQGALTPRPDIGWTYSPTPYQNVLMADFSAFKTPGEYQLVVPGYGASLPFLINDGVAMSFARAYALGLYEQRCGTDNAMPFTRFTHAACHVAPASVPSPQSSFNFTWNTIAGYSGGNSSQTAPQLRDEASQLYPFVNKGTVDVHGGHHDAGDYSKYTINVASLTHYLMFAVDSFAGVAALDNLGIPESGDGISDVMQEAKWEADYICRLQDADGGFYFIVYPQNREYESNVTPDNGDPQVVWPKNTASTAASVAALAQCASSPAFKAKFPEAAALYLQKAKLGWTFLMNAIAKYGKDGAYQKITFYGDDFMHNDELAWAATEMYLATGDATIHQKLLSWFNPTDPATYRWGWVHMYQCYGNAIRSYAFAVKSGRAQASQLDATFLSKCQSEIAAAANDALTWSKQSAYGTGFPQATKGVRAAGWYFSDDSAFDITVGYQLNPRADYLDAIVGNMNYEGGCNPVNVTYVTGLGWKRQREVVSQEAANDRQVLPPTGIPIGNVQDGFPFLSLYQSQLGALCFPSDGASTAPYPFYDRWGDTWNVSTEMVGLNMARGLGNLAALAALTPAKSQAYVAKAGTIKVPATMPINVPVTATFQAPAGMDLNGARIVWEARGQEPAYGTSYTFTPTLNGGQWVEAEAQWPDGRRAFATTDSSAFNSFGTVTVAATDATASRTTQDPGVWTFTRTGDTSSPLTVNFQFAGSAAKWTDYRTFAGDMPETIIIPAGATTATLTIHAVAGTTWTGTETAILTLTANPAYNLGTPRNATITLN
ncbi:MAG: hypothetical protein JWR19_2122 [Pedosphaera sp.]|nr:hypothetical protein [Pedosphaera sp.]